MQDKIIDLAGREETAGAVMQGIVRELVRGGWRVVVDFSSLDAGGRDGCLEVHPARAARPRYLTCHIESEGGELEDVLRYAQRTAQPVRIRAFTVRPSDAQLRSWDPDALFESSILESESNGTVLVAKTINDFTAVCVRYAPDVKALIASDDKAW